MKRLGMAIGLVVCLFLLSACQSLGPEGSLGEAQKEEVSGPLLVQVNDWKMGLEDFEERLKMLEPVAQQQNIDTSTYQFKASVLNELVRTALLAEEAKARKLYKEKDVIDALARYKQSLLAQKLIMEETGRVIVTDVEVENFYKQNEQYFTRPAQVSLKEIVVNDEKTAKDLYIKLLQGEDFSELARQYSVADSREQGGDLGYLSFGADARFKKFWDIVAMLNAGEISNIFKGDDQKFYIVKVEDKRAQTLAPLSPEVKENIRRALGIEKRNQAIQELINTARKKAKVVINDDLLR